MSTTTTDRPRRLRLRLAALVAAAALAGALSPIVGAHTAPAYAYGDVCDLCSLNFDPTACAAIGGWPYDSTLESPPPAVAGGAQPAPQQPAPAPAAPQPAAPAPAAPAPAAPQPAAPQPVAPQTSSKGTASTTTEGTAVTQGGAAVVATAPTAPTLAYTVSGTTLSLSWAAPADGGAALTGYKLVLNSGTPIGIPADATEYEIALGDGSYDAVLIATNSVGDSAPSAALADIEIRTASATPTPRTTLDASGAVTASDSEAASPVAGVAVIAGLVLTAGALLGWWWLRRRNAPPASAHATDVADGE